MWMRRSAFLLITVVLPIPAAVANPGEWGPSRPFDSLRDGPLELMDELRHTAARPGLAGAFFPFDRPAKGWIRDAHLLGLFRLDDSAAPCAHILLLTESRIPTEPSTCGVQARILIRWYLEDNGSPAGLNPTRADIDRWWQNLPTPLVPRP